MALFNKHDALPKPLWFIAAMAGLLRAFSGPDKKRSAEPPTGDRASGSDRRGRAAATPSDIPAKGWWDIGWRVIGGIQEDRVMLVAAGVTFYALLALFPATAALVSLYGLFTDPASISQHLSLVSGFLPEGAIAVIGDQVKRISAQGAGTLSFTFVGTLLLSLWGANAATKAIFEALNIIYKERERRGFISLTLHSLAFTVAGLLMVLLAISGIVLVPVAFKLLGIAASTAPALLSLLRWPLLYVALLFALACLYRYGPSRARPQWRWVTWGSGIAGAIWLIGSLILSWYVANFGSYNATYGSLGAVIGFLIWMWLSTIIVLGGAEINAEMEHQTARDTTDDGEKPLGARGARMADEVGEVQTR
jgi:membrane protein